MLKGTLFLLTLIVSGCLFSQDDVRHQLVLKRGATTKVLNKFNDMTILSRINNNRMIFEAAVFITPTLQIVGDSLSVTANQSAIEEERTIGETKITTIDYPMSQPGIVKFHVNELDKITVGRTAVKVGSGLLCTLSVLSAIAVAPAMYIGPQFNYTRYRQMVGASLISAASFLVINVTLGTKTYHFNSRNANKNWQLQAVINE